MRKYFPYAVLLAELLVFYRQVLFYPGYVFPWDLRYYHYPHAWFIAQSFRHFDLPLWDPFTFCGRPFLANLQTQALYPPLALLVVLSNLLGGHLLYFLECHVILHIFLGGVFAYWLLKRLGAGVPGALLGATVFQLGGFFPAHVEHMGAVCAAAWMPLAWLSVISLRDSLRWLPVLAIALAMSVLAGYTPLTALVFASTLALAILLVFFRQAKPRLAWLALAGCLWAALAAAVQLWPSIELTGLSVARYRTDWLKSGGGLPLQSLVSLFWPDFYHIFDLSRYSWHWEITHMYLYCGALGLALAVGGASLLRKRKETGPFAVLAVLSLVVALGDSTPFGGALFWRLPAFLRNGMHPEFASACFVLGVAVLAGLAADSFFRLRPLAYAAVALAALDLILMGSGRPMNTTSEAQEPGVTHSSFHGSAMEVQRLRMLVDRTFPPARIDTIDSSIHWVGTAPLLEIPTAGGDDQMALARLIQARLVFCQGERWGSYYQVTKPNSPVLDLENVRYLLSGHPVEGLTAITRLRSDYVYEKPDVLPRFFLVHRIRAAQSEEEAVRLLRSPDFDPRRDAIVEGLGPDTAFPDSAPGQVKVLRYEPRTVLLEVDTPAPAYLATSEANYPGWRAFIEGREAPFYYTNVAFRGLPVPAGRSRILMRFAPPMLKRAAALSAVAWLVALGCLWISRRR